MKFRVVRIREPEELPEGYSDVLISNGKSIIFGCYRHDYKYWQTNHQKEDFEQDFTQEYFDIKDIKFWIDLRDLLPSISFQTFLKDQNGFFDIEEERKKYVKIYDFPEFLLKEYELLDPIKEKLPGIEEEVKQKATKILQSHYDHKALLKFTEEKIREATNHLSSGVQNYILTGKPLNENGLTNLINDIRDNFIDGL